MNMQKWAEVRAAFFRFQAFYLGFLFAARRINIEIVKPWNYINKKMKNKKKNKDQNYNNDNNNDNDNDNDNNNSNCMVFC